ncbi:flagellar export protein FliJ [Anaeromyxobacter paludicola]|uniref:Flagellar FliJ protein n=1 Tax=Anaeromyxobacter paludicola TaxID=2918171 RepID=A0ABN6N485_9BACT|nr:flagellar FliJ family protein [Anaeromyxobacter paludicola]BDG08003.1 hypothetical protein AMPC_11160 [Anaeromyxobacter paludicola]
MAAPKTRLDKLVKLRDRSEETALAHLARAQASLSRARENLEGALTRARSDERSAGQAALWMLVEAAHTRDLHGVRIAEQAVASAADGEARARASYGDARQQAEVVRRIADRKRAELVKEEERRERKVLDELATIRFGTARAGRS